VRASVYYVSAVALVCIGIVGIFSIGMPLLLLGATMLAVGRHRGRPDRFWPPLAGTLGLIAGFVTTAPLGCTTSASDSDASAAATTCANIIGIDYSGNGGYSPPLWPALVVGVLTATVIAAITRQRISGTRCRGRGRQRQRY
jgi:hypothetical protein